MKTTILISSIISLTLISCIENGTVPTEDYDIKDFNIREANVESIPFASELINATDFAVYADSILIVMNKQTAGHALDIYNINSGKQIFQGLNYGRGPGEVILTNMRLYGDKLIINDFAQYKYLNVNMNDLIAKAETFSLGYFFPYKNDGSILTLYPMDNANILYLNSYCFESKEHGINNKEPRFFYNDRKFNKDLFFSFNLSQGKFVVNEKDSLIFFASSSVPEAEIYNFSLDKIKKITGPTKMKVSYYIKDDRAAFLNNAAYAYNGITSDGDFIYATYSGNQSDNTKEAEEDYSFSYILKFNWMGKLIKINRIPFLGRTISTTSTKNTFFIKGYDSMGNIGLYKVICDDL